MVSVIKKIKSNPAFINFDKVVLKTFSDFVKVLKKAKYHIDIGTLNQLLSLDYVYKITDLFSGNLDPVRAFNSEGSKFAENFDPKTDECATVRELVEEAAMKMVREQARHWMLDCACYLLADAVNNDPILATNEDGSVVFQALCPKRGNKVEYMVSDGMPGNRGYGTSFDTLDEARAFYALVEKVGWKKALSCPQKVL